jgi:hypothetical protein
MIDLLWPFKQPLAPLLQVAYWTGARDGALVTAVSLILLYLFLTREES